MHYKYNSAATILIFWCSSSVLSVWRMVRFGSVPVPQLHQHPLTYQGTWLFIITCKATPSHGISIDFKIYHKFLFTLEFSAPVKIWAANLVGKFVGSLNSTIEITCHWQARPFPTFSGTPSEPLPKKKLWKTICQNLDTIFLLITQPEKNPIQVSN